MKKNNNYKLVSIVIPTRNSAAFLDSCLKHIRLQTYPNIEIIIVDGKSTDNVKELSDKYKCEFYTYVPKVSSGIFDAPHKRNYGMKKARGEYVYWLDADMELSKNLINEAVELCEKGVDAVILREDSFGIGIWAKAKQLERRCYWGDDNVESPRFFKKSVWHSIGGFDLSLGAGGDDIDLSQKLKEKNFRIGRAKSVVMHNEGNLSIIKLFKKRFMYGREMVNYLNKRPKSWLSSYNPIKGSYLRNWRLFAKDPLVFIFFVVMRAVEYFAGFCGMVYNFFQAKYDKK